MFFFRVSVLSAALCAFAPFMAEGQAIPPLLQEGLKSEFQFTAEDFQKAEAGEAVTRMAATDRPDDVRMAGIVLIKVSSDAYLKAFRDVEHFQVSREAIQTRRFSSPPVEADLAGFSFADFKKGDLQACRPGHCSFKMPAEEMATLQKSIDWNAADANARAASLLRTLIIAYVNRYRANGDPALAVYYDTPSPYSVADGLHSLIGKETHIARAMPDLIRFASEYPQPIGLR